MTTAPLRSLTLAGLALASSLAACSGSKVTFSDLSGSLSPSSTNTSGGGGTQGSTSTGSSASGGSESGGGASGSATQGSGGGDGGGDATAGDAAEAAPPNPCPGLTVCDDFESAPAGAAPKTSLWAVGAPDCGPNRGVATIDTAHAHSGQQSVKVVNEFMNGNPAAYCDHVFFKNVSAFATSAPQPFYARFFMYLDKDVGMNHVTFATMTDKNAGGSQLRLGFDSGVFVWNRVSDQAFLPELDQGSGQIDVQVSSPPASETWMCVEIHVDPASGTLETWVNDAAVTGLGVSGSAVPNVSTLWVGQGQTPWRPMITDLGFGWEAYMTQKDDEMTLWFDDIAIAGHRIGCAGSDL